MNNHYIYKCQILTDILFNRPPNKNTTQEMINELKEEGFLDENNKLTAMGKITAKIIKGLFSYVDERYNGWNLRSKLLKN